MIWVTSSRYLSKAEWDLLKTVMVGVYPGLQSYKFNFLIHSLIHVFEGELSTFREFKFMCSQIDYANISSMLSVCRL